MRIPPTDAHTVFARLCARHQLIQYGDRMVSWHMPTFEVRNEIAIEFFDRLEVVFGFAWQGMPHSNEMIAEFTAHNGRRFRARAGPSMPPEPPCFWAKLEQL